MKVFLLVYRHGNTGSPMCVVGIGLSAAQWSDAWGAFLLFLTNFLSILLAGGAVFALLGLGAAVTDGMKISRKRRAYRIIALGVVLIVIPLSATTAKVGRDTIAQVKVTNIVKQWASKYPSNIVLKSVLVSGSTVEIIISGTKKPATIVTASARYYKKFSRHTVATRLSTKLGYELDSSKQFSLGANSGLRGYPARQFTGERQLLMNLEDRQFWGSVSIGPKIEVGTVLFVDAGNVWKEEEEIDMDELNWSTGFGFRLGFSNMPKQPIFRIDFGWSVDYEGDNNFAVTIGQEQHF